jgi:hypothetical protein
MEREADDHEIENITRKLQELELVTKKLAAELNVAREEIKNLEKKRNEHPRNRRNNQKPNTNHDKKNTFEAGDRVEIVNPTKEGENKGTVIGCTPSGYVKFRTNKGRITRRLPRNLRILQKGS